VVPGEWLAVSSNPPDVVPWQRPPLRYTLVLYGGVMAAGRQPGDKSVAENP